MINEKLKKRFLAKIYTLIVLYKKCIKVNNKPLFFNISKLQREIKDKESIVVVCSGPSAAKLEANYRNFFLTTNESYRLVENFNFLYYVNDGFVFKKFLARAPFCRSHDKTIYFYRREDKLHEYGFKYFISNLRLLKNTNFLLSNFDCSIPFSNSNYTDFLSTLKKNDVPIKIQNSGIFLLLFGFYLAIKFDKKLEIYGLDLGVGGKKYFYKGGVIGKSVMRDKVKANTKRQLDIMYKIMDDKIKNYSYFNPN